ncbi:MAG TPA: metallophosphoesterase family protein [Thermoleophilaceae bacterium]|nr:metallophosphoesterase family protein [Thermoleophilaceae bacterium]
MNDRPAHTKLPFATSGKLSPDAQAPEGNGAPTRIALLTDVHGNLPAFIAVLADVDAHDVDAIWFLGDLVGYGAQPDECVKLAAERCDLCLAGNHDLGVLDRISIGDFSPTAAKAALWTRQSSTQETLDFLGSLEPLKVGGPIGLYHASPRDPVWEYVLSAMQAEACMDLMSERVGAIGHSHVALRFTRADGDVTGEQVRGGSVLDLSEGDWLVNPGSVGQPRDGDPRAAWMLLDVDTWTGEWRRVEYPIDDAAEAIVEAGLPRSLGERLYLGQ